MSPSDILTHTETFTVKIYLLLKIGEKPPCLSLISKLKQNTSQGS